MELWIRSQDKEILIKVRCITIEDNKIYADNGNHTYHILGEYSTEKQALDVLDEIMAKMFISDCITITKTPKLDDSYTGHFKIDVVYQMPEDKGE